MSFHIDVAAIDALEPAERDHVLRELDALADALEREQVLRDRVFAKLRRLGFDVREPRTPLNGEYRTNPDGSRERYEVGRGWVSV